MSGISAEVRGAEQLADLGKALKASGDGQLRRDLLRGTREAVKPVIPEIRQSARDTFPRRGGAAEAYASKKIAVRSSLSPRAAAVRLVSTSPGRLREADVRGILRHPLFGNRDRWFSQSIRPGWWSRPIEHRIASIRGAVTEVMQDTAQKIERSV